MTIYDIAKLAGVSTATVSRVLNGGKSVSEETRQAVMHVIRQNDYQPSAIARGLSLKTMNMIGILAADCQSVFLSMAIHHLENFLRDNPTALFFAARATITSKKRIVSAFCFPKTWMRSFW